MGALFLLPLACPFHFRVWFIESTVSCPYGVLLWFFRFREEKKRTWYLVRKCQECFHDSTMMQKDSKSPGGCAPRWRAISTPVSGLFRSQSWQSWDHQSCSFKSVRASTVRTTKLGLWIPSTPILAAFSWSCPNFRQSDNPTGKATEAANMRISWLSRTKAWQTKRKAKTGPPKIQGIPGGTLNISQQMALCGSWHKTSASLSAWQHTVHDQAENLPSNRLATRSQKKISFLRAQYLLQQQNFIDTALPAEQHLNMPYIRKGLQPTYCTCWPDHEYLKACG